jgi:hypothetical protein
VTTEQSTVAASTWTVQLLHTTTFSDVSLLLLVVLQVLDARDPAGCRCPDVERYVRSLDPGKRIILLLNKMGEPPLEIVGLHMICYIVLCQLACGSDYGLASASSCCSTRWVSWCWHALPHHVFRIVELPL